MKEKPCFDIILPLYVSALKFNHPSSMFFPLSGLSTPGRHDKQLKSLLNSIARAYAIFQRSIFNMIHVYNLLPLKLIDYNIIHNFQQVLKQAARSKYIGQNQKWSTFLIARAISMQNLICKPFYRIL